MKKYKKNVAVNVEFGCFDNFAMLTPIEILKERDTYYVINFLYPNGKQTIDLCIEKEEVAIETFE